MNTDLTFRINSTSSDSTEQIASSIGTCLRGGEIIELRSDVGGGKTTFTSGLVRGAGSNDDVASPTFTISKVYTTPKFEVHHFDFYRLTDPGILSHELQEIITDATAVIVVEWGDIINDVLPKDHIVIEIVLKANESRELIITVPKKYEYIAKGLMQ